MPENYKHKIPSGGSRGSSTNESMADRRARLRSEQDSERNESLVPSRSESLSSRASETSYDRRVRERREEKEKREEEDRRKREREDEGRRARDGGRDSTSRFDDRDRDRDRDRRADSTLPRAFRATCLPVCQTDWLTNRLADFQF